MSFNSPQSDHSRVLTRLTSGVIFHSVRSALLITHRLFAAPPFVMGDSERFREQFK